MRFKTSKKIYLHVDCDSFFASCEVLKNPEWKGRCLCVWEEIVLASTYEAKNLQIKTWTPIWEAKKILKNNGIFCKPDFYFYAEISQKLMVFLKKYSQNIEVFSVDEAFCDITWIPEYYQTSLQNYIKKLQSDIYEQIGIPVSIGCAETKIKAKIYSKLNKPFGIYNWFEEDEKKLFQKLPIKNIPFIWKKSQEKLKYSCVTIFDFLQYGYWNLQKVLWKNGTDLWLELCGVEAFHISKKDEIQSMSRSRSFNKHINSDYVFLYNELQKHFFHLYDELFSQNKSTKKVSLLLRTKNFETLIFSKILPQESQDRRELWKIIQSMLQENYQKETLYRSCGILFEQLKTQQTTQLNLFQQNQKDTFKNTKNLHLEKTIMHLNQKFGNKIQIGAHYIERKEKIKLWIKSFCIL